MRCALRRVELVTPLVESARLVKAWFAILLGSMAFELIEYGPEPRRGPLFSLEASMALNMFIDDQEIISSQVILQSASGKHVGSQTAVTADNLRDFQPAAEAIAEVSQAFAAGGFNVGPTVGNSFSITAPAGIFKKFFKTRLGRTIHGGLQFIREEGAGSEELPREGIPESIARHVVAVTFTPPPDFGPTAF
jgi:hypothetical protein